MSRKNPRPTHQEAERQPPSEGAILRGDRRLPDITDAMLTRARELKRKPPGGPRELLIKRVKAHFVSSGDNEEF